MAGVLYGVGVGPGEPELMTLKAVRTIERCEVIATPKTRDQKSLALEIAKGACNLDGKVIEELSFLMTRDQGLLEERHNEIADQIRVHLDAGKDVAMLNLGDISVFSTFSYIMDILEGKGYQVEMIPGITSFCAIASTLKMSLTTMHKPLHILPAGSIEECVGLDGTKVVMKSGKAIGQLKEVLKEKASNCEIKAVSNCGLENEVICHTIDEISEDASYFTTVIIKEEV